MPINQSDRVGIIHIPRTGGTYLEHLLGIHIDRSNSGLGGNYNGELDGSSLFGRGFQHLTYEQYSFLIGSRCIDYRWITIIRDPYERLLSVAGHTYHCNRIDENLRHFLWFWIKFIYYRCYSMLNFGFTIEPAACQHIRSQFHYLKGAENVTILPFRDISNFEMILYKLDFKVYKKPKERPNARIRELPPRFRWLSPVNKALIRFLYAKDYNLLNNDG